MAASSSPPEGGTSAVSNQKVVKDMRSASVEVLRKTAKDVFLSKTVDVDGDNNNRRHDDDHHQHLLHPEDQLPKYDVRELTIGRVVGRGAFCVVKECSFSNASGSNFSVESGSSRCSSLGRFSSIGSGSTHRQAAAASSSSSSLWNSKASKASSSSRGGGNDSTSQGGGGNGHGGGSDHEGELASRSDVPRRNRKSRARYVIKQLCPDLFHADKITYLKGLVDIAMETRFVASLDHDNIIAAHGVSSQDPFSDGYFIILEKINDTLSKRVKKWMDMDRQCKGITGVFTGSKKKLVQLDTERLLASYDLAVGMNYLHERNIAFRDLKPDNVGFDNVGVLKIFDFGLAKELREEERTADGLYKMTGCTGAVRYMSPENALSQPYNLSTDVYSWSMIMWYLLALEPPFALYTESMIFDRVTGRGYRPKTFSSWSPRIATIIQRSWSASISNRPTFKEIAHEMKMELAEVNPKQAAFLGVSTGEE